MRRCSRSWFLLTMTTFAANCRACFFDTWALKVSKCLIYLFFFRLQDRHRLAVPFAFLAILKNGAEFSRPRNASRRARNPERRGRGARAGLVADVMGDRRKRH